jgi:hypothetical protein
MKRDVVSLGERLCPVCQSKKSFQHVKETNYFCLFGLRLLPLEKISNYLSCEFCENAFAESAGELVPSQLAMVKRVIAYALVGYGMQEHQDLACDVFKKITGFEIQPSDLLGDVRRVAAGKSDVLEDIRRENRHLNTRGRQQIIEAAFLVTHACCEIQYEDRLRLNLIANAMNLPITFVTATIDQVRKHGCYGVRRILPTQAQV